MFQLRLNHLSLAMSLLMLLALVMGCASGATQPTPAAPTAVQAGAPSAAQSSAAPSAMIPAAPSSSAAPAVAASVAASSSPVATAQGSGSKLNVVAAENFWGSIASQLGGDRVNVTSIISDPDTDPHDYEPSPRDARMVSSAQYAIVNGVGYDPWVPQLLAASPASGRVVLTVGDLVGVKEGGNPHRWYSPPDVRRVIDQITADYKRLDSANSAYYDGLREQYVNQRLASYTSLINDIKTTYGGTPVGASESIFAPLADALGLRLLTPESFLDAISEGTDPTAADLATINTQIGGKQIKAYVYNSQNATPDVQAQVDAARAQGIPVTTITETLAPPTATFQDWQTGQLQALRAALAQGTGR